MVEIVAHVENMFDNNNQGKHHKNCVEEQVHNLQMLADLRMLVRCECLNGNVFIKQADQFAFE